MASQDFNYLLDGGCFSKAKIDRSACNTRRSPVVMVRGQGAASIDACYLAGGDLSQSTPSLSNIGLASFGDGAQVAVRNLIDFS